MFTRNDLNELLESGQQPAISLYLPTVVAGRETRQNPIRLKNLVAQAAERLHREPAQYPPGDLLAPALSLVADEAFWRHQESGLAVFLRPGWNRVHRLPLEVAEEVMIGPNFHIKPLLPLLDDEGPFWLLTISGDRTRLYRGSRWSLAESGDDLPQGVASVAGDTQYEETHSAAPSGRHAGGLAKAQPLGDAPEELRKTELTQLLRRVASAVGRVVAAAPAPLVLAAHPEIQGHFRRIGASLDLWPEGIAENPDAMRPDELHRRAASLLAAKSEAACRALLDRLNALLGSRDGKATIRPTEIVKASCHGQIDSLLITGDEHLWGSFDEAQDRVVAHGSAAPGDIDLLDYAALMTLRQGGQVRLVDPSSLPPHTNVAAILRY